MLTLDLAVNGRQIGHIFIVNRGPVDGSSDTLYEYRVNVEDSFVHLEHDHGTVLHHRDQGAFELARKVIVHAQGIE